MSRKGIVKHGNCWKVDTTVYGHRIVRSGFAMPAMAAEWLFKLKEDQTALDAYLRTRLMRPGVLLSEIIGDYYREHDVKSPRGKHRSVLRKPLELMGPLQANAIRDLDCARYKRQRLTDGVGPKTVRNELLMVRAALNWGFRNDLCDRPRFRLESVKSRRLVICSHAEFRALLDSCGTDVGLQCAIRAAWTLGLRESEMTKAKLSWVTARSEPITHGELTFPVGVLKNDEPAVLPIPPDLWTMLQALPSDREYLFSRSDGRPWGKAFRDAWCALRKRAGVSHLWFHDLRRSMSTHSQEAGHTIGAVKALGHWSDVSTMLRHYSGASKSAVLAVAVDLERRIAS